MNELPGLPDAADDQGAAEVLRAWVVGEELHCSLNASAFNDPATWGMVLADVARHIAQALHEDEGRDTTATLAAIRAALDEELARSASEGGVD